MPRMPGSLPVQARPGQASTPWSGLYGLLRPLLGHSHHISSLRQYHAAMSMDKLQEAIRLGRTAIDVTPMDHPDRARHLNDLGNAFRDQYQRTGSIDDLQEAIRLFQATVDATPEDHPDRARRLNSLGLGLGDRYRRTGSIDNLQEAIRFFQAA